MLQRPGAGAVWCRLRVSPVSAPSSRLRLRPSSERGLDEPTAPTHRVLRVQGGRLVVSERRQELEAELDAAATEGFVLVNSFAVDDNVYLVMRKPG